MAIVELQKNLPDGAHVIYSTLAIPDDREEVNCEVAAVRLENGLCIDAEWDDANAEYVITVFKEDYDRPYSQARVSAPSDVLDLVAEWSREWLSPYINAARADTSSTIEQAYDCSLSN